MKRTTAAFNKHVIRRKTAGSCITDGAVLGISKEGTTHTDGSLFQHLVMHIAQNFIPMLNNQCKQYRCYYFSGGSSSKASSRDFVPVPTFDTNGKHEPQNLLQLLDDSPLCEERLTAEQLTI